MNSELILWYEFGPDGDDFGRLIAQVETPQFKGRNSYWVQWQDIGDFAARLSSYPIEPDCPVVGAWGFEGQKGCTAVTTISISPKGMSGGLLVDVSLADYFEPNNRCRMQFQTDYPSVDR